jgi:hypothetical protein
MVQLQQLAAATLHECTVVTEAAAAAAAAADISSSSSRHQQQQQTSAHVLLPVALDMPSNTAQPPLPFTQLVSKADDAMAATDCLLRETVWLYNTGGVYHVMRL